MLSDIFPTGFHGAYTAGVKPGSTVYVAGGGPVGLAAAYSAMLLGAAVVFVGDLIPERLHGRDLAESASPSQRTGLRVIGRECTFFEAVEDKAVLKAEGEIVLQGAVEVHLGFHLVAEGKSPGGVRDHIVGYFYRVESLDLTFVIDLFDDMHGG
jgi:hypothetical protein